MFIIEVIKMHGYINEILKALKMYLWNHLEIHVCQYTRLQDIWEHFLYSIYTVYLQWKSQHLVKIEYVNMTFQHFLLSLTFFFFFFCWYWGLNWGPHTCWAGTQTFSPLWDWRFTLNYLAKLQLLHLPYINSILLYCNIAKHEEQRVSLSLTQ
jgi:hypothetical protein